MASNSIPEEHDQFESIHVPATSGRTSSQHDGDVSFSSPATPGTSGARSRSSTTNSYIRNAGRRFSTSGMPLGFFQASGQVVSSAPSLRDIQTGNLDGDGWSGVGQRRNSTAWKDNDGQVLENVLEKTQTGGSEREKAVRRYSVANPTIDEVAEMVPSTIPEGEPVINSTGPSSTGAVEAEKDATGLEESVNGEALPAGFIMGKDGKLKHDPKVPYANGYQFPPKHTKMQSVKIGLRAYWRFLWTPFGFLLTLYSLNIVAWGGMLFLVLIGGAPAMCHPEIIACNDKDSTKNVWIENDSQIVNALFCVTGLGLIPWRFRDLYYLLQWRWKKNIMGLRRLAGINRDWVRLPNFENLDIHWDPKIAAESEINGGEGIPAGFEVITFAYPLEKSPDPPLTGERAPPTKLWKLDFYIWCYVWNTIFQIMLCGVMWGLNRHTRPAWTTGCLIPVACVVAAAGGIVTAKEGKKVKSIEGVPVSDEDLAILREMREREKGISGGEEGRTEEDLPHFADPKPTTNARKSVEEGPLGEK